MAVAPGYAHLHAIKILNLYKFLALRKLVPPLLICKSGSGATRVMLNKICTRTAKSAPPLSLRNRGTGSPSLHPRFSLLLHGAQRDSFLAKVPVSIALLTGCPVLASGNTPPRQAVSFAKMIHQIIFIRSALLPGRYVQAYRHNNMPITKYDNNEKNSFTNFTCDNLD